MLKSIFENNELVRIPVGFVIVMLCLSVAATAMAGDLEWEPYISAGAEYNDNVNESNNPKADYVLTVKPGIRAEKEGGRFVFKGNYFLNHLQYLQGNRANETKHNLNLYGLLEAVEDLFFVEVNETYSQVYKDTTRGAVAEGESYNDLIDQNNIQVSPYFMLHPGKATSIKTGYRYQHYNYSKDSGIDKTNNNLFAYLEHGINPNWQLDAKYDYQNENPHGSPGLERHRGLVGATWDYAEESNAYALFGPVLTRFDQAERKNSKSFAWDVGLVHALKASVLKLKSSLEFEEDPGGGESLERRYISVAWEKNFTRTNLNIALSYNEYSSTGTSGYTKTWLPSISGSHSLSERLQLLFGSSMDIKPDSDNRSNRLYANTGLQYEFAENFSGELMYRYKNSHTEGSPGGTYQVNKLALSLTASF